MTFEPAPDSEAPPGRRRGRPRSLEHDQAITTATVAELLEHGCSGLSMEAVAARAGVAKTTLYRRWPNREDLALDAVSSIKGPIPTPPGISVRDDLLYLVRNTQAHWTDERHGRLMRRLAADATGRPDLWRRFKEQVIEPRHRVYRDVLRRGAERGEIRSDVNPQWVIDLLVSPIVHAGISHAEPTTDAQAVFGVDVVMSWLTPES